MFQERYNRIVLPFFFLIDLTLLLALYFLFSPRASDIDAQQKIGKTLFAFTAGFGIGFYDGFFGPGTGSFFSIAFVALLGYNLTKATAHTKVLNFTANVASLATFIVGGEVVWKIGLAMAVGQVIGASNSKGELPSDRPIHPTDVLATMYRHLGIDLAQETINNSGRPIPLLPDGRPIEELIQASR